MPETLDTRWKRRADAAHAKAMSLPADDPEQAVWLREEAVLTTCREELAADRGDSTEAVVDAARRRTTAILRAEPVAGGIDTPAEAAEERK